MNSKFILLLCLLGLVDCTVVYQGDLQDGLSVVFEEGAGAEVGADADVRLGGPPLGDPGVLENGLTARRGSATKTHSCNHIRGVPSNLRYASEMYPNGLTNFYQKYTEAYGIPVVSSGRVPDDALKRACYITRFLMADHSGVRNNYYRRYGRVGIMATTEYTTNIPEHSWLDPTFWNARARGLGATEAWPISTGAEENVLCYARDSYSHEDIFLHEFSHGIHLLGAKYAISGFDQAVTYWYNARRSQGLWARTYAMSTKDEYFAEGVQSWFGVNAYANPPDGVHNHVNTKEKLRTYDYELYKLVAQVFPCGNTLIKRCDKSRSKENAQKLLMNCNEGDGEREEGGEDGDDEDDDDVSPDDCKDLHENCRSWKDAGYCSGQHEEYMTTNCKKSCDRCGTGPDPGPDPTPSCEDDDSNCGYWANGGYCSDSTYAEWMAENCKKSCNKCYRREEEEEDEEEEEEEDEDLPPVNCYDRNPGTCKKKAQKGHCKSKASYMRKNCKKSCDFC